jgi:hypothetical protein
MRLYIEKLHKDSIIPEEDIDGNICICSYMDIEIKAKNIISVPTGISLSFLHTHKIFDNPLDYQIYIDDFKKKGEIYGFNSNFNVKREEIFFNNKELFVTIQNNSDKSVYLRKNIQIAKINIIKKIKFIEIFDNTKIIEVRTENKIFLPEKSCTLFNSSNDFENNKRRKIEYFGQYI